MKSFPVVALVFLVLCLQPFTVCAQDAPAVDPTPPPAVAQLFADLAAIPAGATVTDEQHQVLVADLNALAAGVFTPDPDEIDQLATDLGTAAASGLITSDFETELAADFSVDQSDPDDQDGWLYDIEDDVAEVLYPLNDTDPIETFDPTVVWGTSLGGVRAHLPDGTLTRTVLPLTAQGVPSLLLENYSGTVRLITRRNVGAFPVSSVIVRTNGLPPANPYMVSYTRRSDGTAVTLGKLRVHSAFYLLSAQAVSARPAAELLTRGHATFGGHVRKPLPEGFDPADVASVTLTDAQGVVRLSGKVAGATPTRQVRSARLHLSSPDTESAQAPSANLVVRHKATAANASNVFRLMARHLPVNAAVTLLADSAVVDQYTTTARGRLFVIEGFDPSRSNRQGVSPPFNRLRPGTDLSGAKSFTLTDAQGTVLLSGSLE